VGLSRLAFALAIPPRIILGFDRSVETSSKSFQKDVEALFESNIFVQLQRHGRGSLENLRIFFLIVDLPISLHLLVSAFVSFP